MRRFGSPPRPGIVYSERPGAYAVIWRDGQILVTEQRMDVPGHPVWDEIQLPGGGIDPGEGPLEALCREALEETGWRLRGARRLGVYQRFTYMPEYDRYARKICHIYLCAPGLKLGEPREPGHVAYWMDADKAVPALASPGDGWFVAQLLGR